MGSLEKAARAAYEAYRARVPSAGPPWDQLDASGRAIAEDLTRAVLLAVREVDGEAVESVIGRFDADYSRGSRDWLAAQFTALIDSILQEKEET